MSQMNPVNAVPSDFCDIQFNTILPSMPRSLKWSPSVRVPLQTLHTFFFSQYMPHVPIYPIPLDFITLMYGDNAALTHFSPAPVIYEIDLVIKNDW
jgi:hypothetical protein